MPQATKSTKGPSTSMMAESAEEVSQDETSLHEESEPEQDVFTNPSNLWVHQTVYPSKYMPYIEGPIMYWMVNNALYHRFLKCKLKCKNTLECELAALPECQQCRQLWNGSVCLMGAVQRRNESWHNLGEVKKYCNLQSNEVYAWFNLLTSFCQGNKNINKWYKTV